MSGLRRQASPRKPDSGIKGARRRVDTRTALFLCLFSSVGMLMLSMLRWRSAWGHVLSGLLGTLVFFALPAYLGLCVLDGDQRKLLPGRALSGAQVLWLSVTGAAMVCPSLLLSGILGSVLHAADSAAAGAGAALFVPTLLVSGVVAPVCEELFFRGYLLAALGRFGKGRAVVATALLFALAHGVRLELPVYALIGLLLGGMTLRTGSMLAPMILHMAYNAALILLAFLGAGAVLGGLNPLSAIVLPLGSAGFIYALRRAMTARGVQGGQA